MNCGLAAILGIQFVPNNPDLVWRNIGDDQQVKMVVWTSWAGYDDLVGQAYTATREIWVTSVPEVQQFCKRLPDKTEYMVARLEQLLGLPPESGQDRRFVEMWVTPTDLFRPCPDPEITDNVCSLDFPVSYYLTVDPEYFEWFETLKSKSYQQPEGYPWTRLGYTYDWGHPSPLGMSEFIVTAGATVEIDRVVSSMEYCE